MIFRKEKDRLIIELKGRIDSGNADETERGIREILAQEGGIPAFDAGELVYISSAGLRIFLHLMKEFAPTRIVVENVTPEVYDIFSMTGFTELMDIRKRLRELALDGCEQIGQGRTARVYRTDPDTVVKVYNKPDSLPVIRHEQQMAKQVFLKGIPTAISYDIVRVGELYGAVYELIRAETFNDLIIRDPDHADDTIRSFTEFVKFFHSTKADSAVIPSARNIFSRYLEALRVRAGEALYERLKALLASAPEGDSLIHGDFQLKNLLMMKGEPMVIDMDTLCYGHPVYDLQGLFMTYTLFSEDDPGNSERFLGLSDEMAAHIWERFYADYTEGMPEEERQELDFWIRLLARIRFINVQINTDLNGSELAEKRIRRSLKVLSDLTNAGKE